MRCQGSSKIFPFLVNINVGTTGKINPLKRAGFLLQRCNEFRLTYLTRFLDNECMTRLQFSDHFNCYVQGSLNDWPLRCCNNYFIVIIIKGRSNGPRIAHNKRMLNIQVSGELFGNRPFLHPLTLILLV